MAVSQSDLQKAQQVGSQGGNVNTYGMSPADKAAIDAAVRRGNGSGS